MTEYQTLMLDKLEKCEEKCISYITEIRECRDKILYKKLKINDLNMIEECINKILGEDNEI